MLEGQPMEQTSNLKLPYIAPSQAQKHVTHNEAIRALDALVQLSVISRSVKEPPAAPLEGDRYVAGSPASGVWKGRDNQIIAWQDGAWAYFPPQEGWYAWVAEERTFAVYNQNKWSGVPASTNPVPLLGIEALADETNRLSLKSPASLFDHAGGGHQIKINKADDNQAASLLFQSNYQGRAEMGTMGGRDFRIKTSADGNVWQEVMIADSATGIARFPSGISHAGTGKKQSGLIFLPVAPSDATIFQPVLASTAVTIVSVAGNLLNLNANAAAGLFSSSLRGMAMIRIWNTTRSPAQPAWVKWDTATDQVQVSDPAQIKQWAKGDTIQIADPVKKTVAIDISPLMQKLLGSVFAQDGVLLNAGTSGELTLACNELSPVSSSNLVMVKADEKRSFSVIGVYG
jgi:hypothetical protein